MYVSNFRATTEKNDKTIIREEGKQNNKKCSIKTSKGRKTVKDKRGKKLNKDKKENNKEYGGYNLTISIIKVV